MTPSKLNWLRVALWSAAFFGLLEAPLLIFFLSISPINSSLAQFWVDWNALWIAPLVDALLFVGVGAGWMLLSKLVRRPISDRAVLCWYFFLIVFGLLILPIRLYRWASLLAALGLTRVFWSLLARREASVMRLVRASVLPLWAVWLVAAAVIIGGDYQRARADRAKPSGGAPRSNVVLIVVDTLRADRMSLYGYGRPTTPNLEALARESMVFDQALATSSWTLPSHASLFTGLYPYQHGAGAVPLGDGPPTLAAVLSSYGYRTGGFVGNTLFCSRNVGIGRGFEHYDDILGSPMDAFVRTVYGRRIVARLAPKLGYRDAPGRKSAAQVNGQFLRWLDRNPRAPFFAFLNYIDVHAPYFPPAEHLAKFSSAPANSRARRPVNQDWYRDGHATVEQQKMESDAYDAAIHYVDEQIRNLLGELQQRGLLSDTLVVITSDHGEAIFEHGLFGHATSLYRESLHIPLILHQGERFSPGVRDPRIADLSDIPASILSLLQLPVTLPGRVITSPEDTGADATVAALSELDRDPAQRVAAANRYGWVKSLVTQRWHFIQQEDGNVRLYDWVADGQELNDLSTSPEHQALLAEFRKVMAERLQPLEHANKGGESSGN